MWKISRWDRGPVAARLHDPARPLAPCPPVRRRSSHGTFTLYYSGGRLGRDHARRNGMGTADRERRAYPSPAGILLSRREALARREGRRGARTAQAPTSRRVRSLAGGAPTLSSALHDGAWAARELDRARCACQARKITCGEAALGRETRATRGGGSQHRDAVTARARSLRVRPGLAVSTIAQVATRLERTAAPHRRRDGLT